MIGWLKLFTCKDHVIDTNEHHACDRNDCFLMTTPFLDIGILSSEIRSSYL